MSASTTAHSKIVALLQSFAPSPSWSNTYDTHEKANLIIPALSVEVESDAPIPNDAAIVDQELVDNRNIRLSIKIHTGYRLGPVDTDTSMQIADDVVRWLRENIDLGDEYRIFEVVGSAYNVEHVSSGTTGTEILIDIHKVEFYEQN